MKLPRILAASLSLWALAASVGLAGQLFVDWKHAEAGDRNPGTEAKPLKTIQAAADLARPGDTIWVKAGDYEERVVVKTGGTHLAPIVLSAWKDDRVRIGYRPRPLPAAGAWASIPDTRSFQVKLAEDVPEDFLLLVDGKWRVTLMQEGLAKDDQLNWAAYSKSDLTLMFSGNGIDPAKLGRLEYGRRPNTNTFFTVQQPAPAGRLWRSYAKSKNHRCQFTPGSPACPRGRGRAGSAAGVLGAAD